MAHSPNLAVTQRRYIKTLDDNVLAALRLLERSVEKAPNMHLDGSHDSPVMCKLKRKERVVRESGGEGGIRTPGTGFSPYNGLANRRLQPLGHLSGDRLDCPIVAAPPLFWTASPAIM